LRWRFCGKNVVDGVFDGMVADEFSDNAGVENVNAEDIGVMTDDLAGHFGPVAIGVAVPGGLKPEDEPRPDPREAHQKPGKK
jgi:hypothetical protein